MKRTDFDGRRHLSTSDEIARDFAILQSGIGELLRTPPESEPIEVTFRFSHKTRISVAAEKRIRNIQTDCENTPARVRGQFYLETSEFKYIPETRWENVLRWFTKTILRKPVALSRGETQEVRLQQLLSLVSYCIDEGVVVIDAFDQTNCAEQYATIDTYANNWQIIYPLVTPLPEGMAKLSNHQMVFSDEFKRNFNRMKAR